MARKTVFVSDLSGETINEREYVQVVLKYADARRGQIVLDANASDVEDLARRGKKQARRGRRPKEATAG